MSADNLISVIIPVYNMQQYLKQCIDSVINQTYKNLEIILVDDGSTDDSPNICDEYALKDNRIKVIHKQNSGVSSARNAGLDIAKGDYIGFVDSDDFISSDMYETLYNAIIKTDAQFVLCNWFKGNDDNWVEYKNFPKTENITRNDALEIFIGYMFVVNKLFKKSFITDFRFSEVQEYGEDLLFCFNAFLKVESVVCVNKPQYYYRLNFNSVTNNNKFKKSFLRVFDIYTLQEEYAKKEKLFSFKEKLYHKKLNKASSFLGMIALEKNPDMESAAILLKYVKKNILNFLKSKERFDKKCFIILACINFNLASKIYKIINKQK